LNADNVMTGTNTLTGDVKITDHVVESHTKRGRLFWGRGRSREFTG
jgi:hypothetical protein